MFLIASGTQHDCHKYLASLRKYTLPAHPIFQRLICPHYTAECLVYVSFMFLAAPQGAWINRTLFTTLVFVVANLGITAETSREWYEKKFGAKQIEGRWRMVPFVY
jgi:3-oxo-5-alpha-steroid 4-dehydrogenase 3